MDFDGSGPTASLRLAAYRGDCDIPLLLGSTQSGTHYGV